MKEPLLVPAPVAWWYQVMRQIINGKDAEWSDDKNDEGRTMKMCKDHWDVCRKAIDDRGMSGLVAKSGEAAMESLVADLHGQATNKDFDPLMSMHWHWTNNALRAGGLWTMEQDPSGKNDGHYCPLCLHCEKEPGFVAEEAVGAVADQMAAWARSEGLIPAVS